MARVPKTEGRHVRGASLATKLALAIVFMVAVCMAAFALFLNQFIRDTVTEQVKDVAVQAARTAAMADVDAWTEYFATPYQGMTAAEIQDVVSSFPTREIYDQRFLTASQQRQREWNRERFGRLLGADSRVLAARLLSPDRTRRQAATHEDMTFAPYGSREVHGEGMAEEGRLTIGAVQSHVVRGEYPLKDEQGEIIGRFSLYIHASVIDDISKDFMLKVLYASGLFVLLSGGLALFMGRRITTPLQQLQDDMRIVAEGDLEHHTVPHSSDEIGALARTFNSMTRDLAEAQEAEQASARSRHQMGVASEVTASLFPGSLPSVPGYDVGAHHEASAELGGEYYDVTPMPDGRFGLLIASASGTGIPAAMVMVMARSFLAAECDRAAEPDAVLRKVNALMSGDLRRGMYVSVLLAVLDPSTGKLSVANAGHTPLIVYRASTGKISTLHSEGIALGFDKGPVFDRTLKTAELELQPGDRIVLHTAAVAELTAADGEILGMKRFLAVILREAAHPAAAFIQRVAATLKKFRGRRPLSADVTFLTLGRPRRGGKPS